MSLRIKAADIPNFSNRQFFFDANVLLYLFGAVSTPSNQWAVNAYNTVFFNCLKAKSVLCVDITVLSEFINRFIRIEYENYLRLNGLNSKTFQFKNFRGTTEGIQAAQDIEVVVHGKILKNFKLIGKLFNESDIKSISLVNNDFNDALIVETCKEHQCVLVTNDADFSGADIDILTAKVALR